MAGNILDSGKITLSAYLGLKPEEIANLHEIWQKSGQVISIDNIPKDTTISSSSSQDLTQKFDSYYSLIPFAKEHKKSEVELGGSTDDISDTTS
ncbi:hypothetical protein [Candidatus Tisiphia endosymbiont of Nemotelus uliginosus]|uniref:hypothetical protein n=1 Tax=Candidatus Tisiphia endosymbiont of Nemotelus uliginosus TaxID=3077926 RepID=UPI0035C89D07